MDFEQVKQTANIREYAEQHLKRAGRNFYVCPSCHSGEKANKSAAMFMYSDHFYCYSCQCHGDVFDLAEKIGSHVQSGAVGHRLSHNRLLSFVGLALFACPS